MGMRCRLTCRLTRTVGVCRCAAELDATMHGFPSSRARYRGLPSKGRWVASTEYDHKHRSSRDKGVPYLFESAQRLLEDFFAEVDRVIQEAQE